MASSQCEGGYLAFVCLQAGAFTENVLSSFLSSAPSHIHIRQLHHLNALALDLEG